MILRKKTREIHIGNVRIGNQAPVSVQSMTNTQTTDTIATVKQIEALMAAGCDIVRMAVPDQAAAENIYTIKSAVGNVPLVADIHFDYRLALKAMEQGIDALRLNPGNIGDEDRVRAVVSEAKKRGIPIRIGVNAGSLDKRVLQSETPDLILDELTGLDKRIDRVFCYWREKTSPGYFVRSVDLAYQ